VSASHQVEAAVKSDLRGDLLDIIRNSTYETWEEAGAPHTKRPGEGDLISQFPSGKSLVRLNALG
jgi:hypothetical protein